MLVGSVFCALLAFPLGQAVSPFPYQLKSPQFSPSLSPTCSLSVPSHFLDLIPLSPCTSTRRFGSLSVSHPSLVRGHPNHPFPTATPPPFSVQQASQRITGTGVRARDKVGRRVGTRRHEHQHHREPFPLQAGRSRVRRRRLFRGPGMFPACFGQEQRGKYMTRRGLFVVIMMHMHAPPLPAHPPPCSRRCDIAATWPLDWKAVLSNQ